MLKLIKLDENIWYSDQILSNGLISFGIRMVVVKLSSGGLLLHSPIDLDASLIDELRIKGEVKYIIAPNFFHHVYAKAAKDLYPNAQLFISYGLERKIKDLEYYAFLSEEEQRWSNDLDLICIQGMPKLNEFVFYHKSTSTLICSDFVFNIQKETNFCMKLLWKFAGTYKNFGQSRIWRFMVQDKEQMIKSVKRVLNWDFKRIVMAHGEIIDFTNDQLLEVLEKQYKVLLRSS